ncbi:hypothetical protein CspeluHIS016_0801910 [Cutaneotrichosporon spelunceum]|uniref:Guanine nucleotide-binding protein subunit gamma n=1 Tax=Cutaneotrichosporon spelunceum TaxID=1672016 RepID=A0AAD3YDU4_9TREE|nr:hypothetical protein CspeluHIS016_0801910 [Cutaneotrichosporon spelunceum]
MAGNRAISKVTMQELKFRRLAENNLRLRDELSRPRTMVSLASINSPLSGDHSPRVRMPLHLSRKPHAAQ